MQNYWLDQVHQLSYGPRQPVSKTCEGDFFFFFFSLCPAKVDEDAGDIGDNKEAGGDVLLLEADPSGDKHHSLHRL